MRTEKATAMGIILKFSACYSNMYKIDGQTSSSYFNTYLHAGLGKCETIKNTEVT